MKVSKAARLWVMLLGPLALLIPMAGLMPQGSIDAHDPSRIVSSNSIYYYFSTGDKIPMHYSLDLIHWVEGPPVLPNGVPAWAKAAVPANGGDVVWAPDIIYNPTTRMWTMFYAYSSFGSQQSVIGALTCPQTAYNDMRASTLLPNRTLWRDAGLVIASDSSKDYNAIDPAPIFDQTGQLWMTFGSYWTGIKIVQLDFSTLKPIGNPIALAGGGSTDMEASHIWFHNGFYYLFYTQGACCQGVNSTYHIMMGRSANIAGPYVDKLGVSLLNGGGTLLQKTVGTVIGPGQIGISGIDGNDRASFHYYDGAQEGSPKLGLQTLLYDAAGWPILGSTLANGTYRIVNKVSGLSLGVAGESNADNTPVDQWNYLGHDYQKWTIARQLDGTYSIRSLANSKAMSVVGGSAASATPVKVKSYASVAGQQWIVDQTSDGYYRLVSSTGSVLDDPSFSTSSGTQMWTYKWLNGDNQKWSLVAP